MASGSSQDNYSYEQQTSASNYESKQYHQPAPAYSAAACCQGFVLPTKQVLLESSIHVLYLPGALRMTKAQKERRCSEDRKPKKQEPRRIQNQLQC
ncbi:uncharacterized protein M6G45_015003 isoform 2-T2 [Spheniscus humboldti]